MEIKIVTPKAPPPAKLPENISPDIKLILEQFPRIGNRILLLWGTVELQNYLHTLIIDERGDRQGFPPPVIEAILQIYKDHEKLIPDDDKDTWDKVVIL